MAESKSQDKFYPGLKQEGFESFNWPNLDNEYDDYRSANPFLLGKMSNRNPMYSDYNPISMNPDVHNDLLPISNQLENQNSMSEQNDRSNRLNPSFPLFNEKVLNGVPNTADLGMNSIKQQYPGIVMNSIDKMPNYPAPNYFFQFNNMNIRRPIPQELPDEEPVYVNPKQYERIMKLRIKKAQRGMLKNAALAKDFAKDSYKHLSRHLHAKRRERGTGGRFLSKEALKKKQEEEEGYNPENGEDPAIGLDPLGEHHNFDDVLDRDPEDNE